MNLLHRLPHWLRVGIDCVRYRLPLKEWKRYYEGRKFARHLSKQYEETGEIDFSSFDLGNGPILPK